MRSLPNSPTRSASTATTPELRRTIGLGDSVRGAPLAQAKTHPWDACPGESHLSLQRSEADAQCTSVLHQAVRWRRLNEEGVPGPSGREWRDTTIRGQVDRGTGLLNNSLYIGWLEWNRTAYVKNPRTGRKVARINKQEARESVEIPELRIVDDTLWEKVKGRQQEARIEMSKDESSNSLNQVRRRKFLLSELLVCGQCSGRYTVVGKDRYGCATRRAKGTCSNDKTITRQRIESRVLGGLKDKLMAPEMVAEFIRAFQEEFNAAARTAAAGGEERKREAEAVERKIAGIMTAIEDGMYTPALKERMKALETRKAEIMAIMGSAEAPSVVRLHPNASEVYRRKGASSSWR
jgi:site-specific DNA recombinase